MSASDTAILIAVGDSISRKTCSGTRTSLSEIVPSWTRVSTWTSVNMYTTNCKSKSVERDFFWKKKNLQTPCSGLKNPGRRAMPDVLLFFSNFTVNFQLRRHFHHSKSTRSLVSSWRTPLRYCSLLNGLSLFDMSIHGKYGTSFAAQGKLWVLFDVGWISLIQLFLQVSSV